MLFFFYIYCFLLIKKKKEGDRNTQVFHRMANSHRRGNFNKKVRVNACWFEEETNIRRKVVAAFQNILLV